MKYQLAVITVNGLCRFCYFKRLSILSDTEQRAHRGIINPVNNTGFFYFCPRPFYL
jgi:hypothetical protein